jgi:hypothetical protein
MPSERLLTKSSACCALSARTRDHGMRTCTVTLSWVSILIEPLLELYIGSSARPRTYPPV